MLEFGILGKVREIEDDAMRFYTLIGLTVSTAAAIEHLLFDCFRLTCGKDETAAAEEFFRFTRFKYRRDLADGAVRESLKNTSLSEPWDEILSLIQSVCGPDGARNLVSHNPLIRYLVIGDSYDETTQGPGLVAELAVNQNHYAVASGKRAPDKQTFQSLYKYAYDLCHAELRLSTFCENYLVDRA